MQSEQAAPLLAAVAVAAATTWALLPQWVRVAASKGLVGRDMNKADHRAVAEAGGFTAILGGVMGLYVLVIVYRYVYNIDFYTAEVYALTSLLLLSLAVGLLDDLLGWKKGLPRWVRVASMAPAAMPLVAIKAGVPRVELPVVGTLNLGVLYPLVAVPVGVVGAANAFNMIAGYNGLEAGMALILLASVAAYSAMKGLILTMAAALVMAAAVAVFLGYNWYPARVFPGNVFTYGVGSYYAGLVILGNFEKFGLLLFSLYFLKAALYFAAMLACGECRECLGRYEDFAIPRPDGTLAAPPCRTLSLTHYAIRVQERLRGRATEAGVTLVILAIQAAISATLLALAAAGRI
ncbi:MAG: glycosyl transferase family 4 [Desulfurococcales archaeon]|nr:glycosyl transferase family 4 [Desulfurococcales archaeon]